MRSISTDWAIAEPSPTKSITAWAPSPPVSSFTASTGSTAEASTRWCAPRPPTSSSAAAERSTAMISVAQSSPRTWTAMWPSPPTPITAHRVPGVSRLAARFAAR